MMAIRCELAWKTLMEIKLARHGFETLGSMDLGVETITYVSNCIKALKNLENELKQELKIDLNA